MGLFLLMSFTKSVLLRSVSSNCKFVFLILTFHSLLYTVLFFRLLKILPGISLTGHRIMFMKFLDKDPDHYRYIDHFNIIDKVALYELYSHGMCNGFHVICDGKGARFTHILKIPPSAARKILIYFEVILTSEDL